MKISDYQNTISWETKMIMIGPQQHNITFGELKKQLMDGTNIDCKHCGAPVEYNEKCGYCS